MNTRTKLLFTTLLVVAVALVAFHSSGVLAQAADNGLNVMSNARAPAVMQVALNGNSLFHSTRVSTLRTDHERVLGMATTSADDCNLLGLAAVVADRTDDVDGMGVVTYIQNGGLECSSIEIWRWRRNARSTSWQLCKRQHPCFRGDEWFPSRHLHGGQLEPHRHAERAQISGETNTPLVYVDKSGTRQLVRVLQLPAARLTTDLQRVYRVVC